MKVRIKHIIIMTLAVLFSSSLYAQTMQEKQLAAKIGKLNASIMNDTVARGMTIQYNASANIISVTMRVTKLPDPFSETLGRVYKEYYKQVQLYQIVNKWLKTDTGLANLMKSVQPFIVYRIYGKVTTEFDIDYSELDYAKSRIEGGYKFLQSYKDFLIDTYYNSLQKEEFVEKLWDVIAPMAEKVPYSTSEHIVITAINMSRDNVVLYECTQDDITGTEEDLKYEKMKLIFQIGDFNYGVVKAFARNNISIRYRILNKSDGSVFSDVTFTGDQLLDIYNSINKK